jgi:hypothetical protein
LHQPVKDLRPACRPGHQDDRVRRGAGGLRPGSTAATRLQGDLHQCGDHLRRSGAQRSWSQLPLTRSTRSTVIRSLSTMYTTGKDQPSAGDSPRGGTLQPDTGQQPGPLPPPRSPACRLGRPGSGELSLSPRATFRSSRAAAEQLGHRLLMRDSAGPTSGHPRLVRRERGPDFSLLQILGRGVALQGLQPQEISNRHHNGGLATQMDHLKRRSVRDRCGRKRLSGHAADASR